MSLHTWHSRVPTSQAAVPSSHSTLTGAELPQTRKSCIYTCRVTYVVSKSLRPCRLWPARLLCQGGGFSKQEYCSVLTNTGCHTLLLLLLSCFSHVRLCVTPETAAHQAPLSLGFSRQEYWSGLPFLFPIDESEK